MQLRKEGLCLWYLGWVAVICFNEISLQKRKWTPPSSFSAGEVRGLCPPAFRDPWLVSGDIWQDNCKPKPSWRKKTKQKQKPTLAEWWKISLTKVRASRRVDSSPKAVRHLLLSPELWLKKCCVTLMFSLLTRRAWFLGSYCPFCPCQTSYDRTLHGLHARRILKVTMKLKLEQEHLVSLF